MSSTDSATLRPTPGTWKISTIKRGGKPILFIESETPNLDGGPVACVGNAMLPFVQANAHLFVAAKDLYAACLRVIDCEGDGTIYEPDSPFAAIVDAVRKAQGGMR